MAEFRPWSDASDWLFFRRNQFRVSMDICALAASVYLANLLRQDGSGAGTPVGDRYRCVSHGDSLGEWHRDRVADSIRLGIPAPHDRQIRFDRCRRATDKLGILSLPPRIPGSFRPREPFGLLETHAG